MKKRKARKGFVYILVNQDESLFKYGASSYPDERVRHINYKFKNNKFKIIHLMQSNDMFSMEHRIRCFMRRLGVVGEIFGHEIFTKELVLKIANCAAISDDKALGEIYYQMV